MLCLLLYRGVWNVPLIFSAILFKGAWLKNLSNDLPQYHSKNPNFDSDKNFGKWMRDKVYLRTITNYDMIVISIIVTGSLHVCQ